MRGIMSSGAPLTVIVLVILAAALGPSAVHSDVLLPIADAHVSTSSPDMNFGSNNNMRAGGSDPLYRSYFSFATTGVVPTGCTLQWARLWLYVWLNVQTPYINPHLVTGDWSESTLTWNSQPTYEASPLSIRRVTIENGWAMWDVTAGWPLTGNLSLVLEGASPDSGVITFYSKEKGTGYAPHLEVFYTEDISVPEPGTLGLLGALAIPGWMLARRRRKAAG